MLAKVRDKKTGVERTTSVKAYQLIPHRYVLLGYVNDDGSEASGPTSKTAAVTGEKKLPQVKSAAPVVVERPTVTREDLDKLNQGAVVKAQAEIAAKEAEKAKLAPAKAPVKNTTLPKKTVSNAKA